PGCATFSATGLISNTGSACGGASGTSPFIWSSNYNAITAATSSSLWAQNGIFASSTSHFANADFTAATTSAFAVTGQLYANGFVGVGTTTPWAQLSINPTATNGSAPSFVIGSSTGTKFLIANNGFVGVGTSSPWANFSIQATSSNSGSVFAIASTTGSGSTLNLLTISNAGNVGLGNNASINFGSLYGTGSTGYGIRENGGMIEFKNAYASTTALASGWTPITSAASVRYNLNETSWVNTGSILPQNTSAAHTVAVINDYIYIFGGYIGGFPSGSIYRAPVSNPTSWSITSGTGNPGSAYGASLAVLGDYIYEFGGNNGSGATSAIYRAPVSSPANWVNTGATLPGTLEFSNLAVIGDYVYLFGGDGAGSNVIYRAPVSNPTSWVDTGATLPGNIELSSIAMIGDYVYIFGGFNGSAATNVIYRAPVSNPTSWVNTGVVIPANLQEASISVIGDYVYLFGGSAASTQKNTIYRAPLSNPLSWSDTKAVLPTPLSGGASVVLGDSVYLFGGDNSGNTKVIYRATISNNAQNANWMARLNAPTGPWFFATSSNSNISFTSGNVSIGTTTAYAPLSVWGGATGKIFEVVNSASSTALSVSATGFATTTLSGLTISGSATSTSNVGFNIASGCYAMNGTCLTSGGYWSLTGNNISNNNNGGLGFVGVGTTTPWAQLSINPSATNGAAPSFVIGSSTKTNFLVNNAGNIFIGTTTDTINSSQIAGLTIDMGNSTIENAINAYSNVNDFFEFNITNLSKGTAAQSGYAATSDVGTGTTGFVWMGINNSNFYTPATYNVGGAGDTTLLGLGNDMYVANGSANKNLYFLTGGTATTTNTRMTITGSGSVGVGTSTPQWLMQIATSSLSNTFHGGQLAITDTSSAANPHWVIANENGNLYFSTSSPTTFATTSGMTALSITSGPNGARLGINTPYAPRATIDLYEQNGVGVSPSILFGGNAGGDTDFWQGRKSDNDIADDDYFQWGSGITPGTNPLMTLDSTGRLGIGTTTPQWPLNVVSSTNSQLTLGDGTTASPWSFRSVGGNLYIGTSSPATFASSSIPALSIISGGTSGLVGIGTSTPWGKFSVEMGPTHPAFVVANYGSSTPAFVVSGVNQSGLVGIGTSTPWAMLSVNPITGNISSPAFVVGSSSATSFIINNAGQVGVGTTSPGALFAIGSANSLARQNLFLVASSTTGVATSSAFVVDWTGNVGIGTTTPGAKFALVDDGAFPSTRNVFTISTSTNGAIPRGSASYILRVNANGALFSDTVAAVGADYAEYFRTNSVNLLPGEVVCVDVLSNNAVKRCERGADNNVMGIVSTHPSITGNNTAAVAADPSHYAVIGMLGQVDAFVSAENGPINIGDSLTSASSTPGVAMRADGGDSTVGVALESLSSGTGKIKVLISRRNKSLAVEQIESLVTERVAGMKIEDSVNQMVQQSVSAMTMLPQLTVSGNVFGHSFSTTLSPSTSFTLGTTTVTAEMPSAVLTLGGDVDLYKLATYNLSGIQALADRIAQEDIRITSLETRVAALENGSITTASGSPISISTSSLASAFNAVGAYISQGFAQFGTLVSDQFVAATNSAGTSSAGSVTILAGNTVAQVNNAYMKPTTKVLVTFNSSVDGSWWVGEKVDGSFSVHFKEAQVGDATFDYFLIQSDGQATTTTATSTDMGPSVDQITPTITTVIVPPEFSTLTPPAATSTPPAATDSTAPVVSLVGQAELEITVGSSFIDDGATATDDVDGDLTSTIITTGSVDTSTVGTYIVTYSATDAAGNLGSTTRSINVTASPEATMAQ
ncbi:MAG: hypothetical protein JWN18_39, partial [Parcubacteria group bacterium]|nr:hypothetical protein [Parcubacteria group bacterium]